MNAGQLREILDGLDDEVEIRFMSQPSWPFEYSIAGTWRPEPAESHTCGTYGDPAAPDYEPDNYCSGCEQESRGGGFEPEGVSPLEVVYLIEGTQLAYGTKRAWDEMDRPW